MRPISRCSAPTNPYVSRDIREVLLGESQLVVQHPDEGRVQLLVLGDSLHAAGQQVEHRYPLLEAGQHKTEIVRDECYLEFAEELRRVFTVDLSGCDQRVEGEGLVHHVLRWVRRACKIDGLSQLVSGLLDR